MALPALQSLSTFGVTGSDAQKTPASAPDVRSPTGSGQDHATVSPPPASASVDVNWTRELRQALATFESGDVLLAARLLAPLAEEGSPTATYDLNLISEFGLGSVDARQRAQTLYSKPPPPKITPFATWLVA
jgi:hypothetical protein